MKVRSVLSVLAGFTMLFALHAGAQGTFAPPHRTPLGTAAPHQLTPEQIAKMPVKALPIKDFKLLLPGIGWVSTGNSLLFTTDNGVHWKDISPPNPNQDSYADVLFLNSETGWVLMSGHPREGECAENDRSESDWAFLVASTVDGGKSWTETHVKMPSCDSGSFSASLNDNGSFTFTDRLHGWLLLQYQSGSAFSFGILLSSSDGGRTWRETKGNPGFCGTIRAYPNGQLWVTGDSNPNEDGDQKELVVSRDGANSFEQVSLPSPAAFAGDEQTYALPVFTDALHGYEEVAYTGGKSGKSAEALFGTTDGGKTWLVDRILSNLPERTIDANISSAIAGSTWVHSFAPKGSQPTLMRLRPNDRVAAPNSTSSGDLRNCELSSLTPDEGWANCSGELSSTNDGGASWAAITPRVRNGVLSTDPITALPTPKSMKAPQVKLANPKDVPNTSNGPSGGSQSGVDQRLGFDATDVPVPGDMGVWWDHSPYYDVGIYLPGSPNRSSKHAYASKIWVDDVLVQGWGVWPVWFGFQAPCACHPIKTNQSTTYPSCNPFTDHFDFKPSEAEKRGKEQAAAATAAANALGLDGSIIYTDLEQYTSSDTDVANPSLTCGAAVQA